MSCLWGFGGLCKAPDVSLQFEDPTDALQSLREHVDLQRAFATSTLPNLAKEVQATHAFPPNVVGCSALLYSLKTWGQADTPAVNLLYLKCCHVHRSARSATNQHTLSTTQIFRSNSCCALFLRYHCKSHQWFRFPSAGQQLMAVSLAVLWLSNKQRQ